MSVGDQIRVRQALKKLDFDKNYDDKHSLNIIKTVSKVISYLSLAMHDRPPQALFYRQNVL